MCMSAGVESSMCGDMRVMLTALLLKYVFWGLSD